MPYTVKGKCIFKKDGGAKVGCTKGSVDKYLAALYTNVDESTENKLVDEKSDKETKTKEMNENTKTLIKKLLRENIEEGPIGRALGTAAMAASTLMSPKVQASAPKPPTEMTSEKLGVVKNEDGSFTSTVQTDGPNKEIAKELAIEKAKNQILYKLGLPKGSVVNVKVMNIKTKKLDNGTFICLITINAYVQ